MVSSPTDQKYSLRRLSLIAVAHSLLEFLTLQDTSVILISSDDSALSLEALCSVLQPDCQPGKNSPNSYIKLNQRLESENHPSPLLAPEANSWLPCSLNLLDIFLEAAPNQRLYQPSVLILGLGDRFSVLLQAQPLPLSPSTAEGTYQVNLVYEPTVITACCNAIQTQLSDAGILEVFGQAIGWLAQPNLPDLQSALTLRLLSALETNYLGSTPVADSALTLPQQQHWLQQERLLYELLHASNATLGPQVILRRSAEVIRTIFGVTRCLIAFYSPRGHRVIWGAIARSPELLTRDRHALYPDWVTIEQLIAKHNHSSTWVSDELPWLVQADEATGLPTAHSALASWTQADAQRAEKWVGGFLSIEQWDHHRVWQPEEMYLLHMAIHQIEQAIEQALYYQQAEERAQREALLNRLIAQIRGSLDLSQIFETVVTELGHLVVIDRCSIWQYVEEQRVWQILTEYRAHAEIASTMGLTIPDPDNPYAAQLKKLQIVQVSDTRTVNDPVNKPLAEQYPGAWLLVPIHHDQKLWGCIMFNQDNYPRFWHESELQFLTTIADHLAIALQQATLYQQIQAQKQTLEAQVAHRTAELEGFFDTLPDYIYVIEREAMGMPFCNHAFAKGIGFATRQQVQGKSIFECFPPDMTAYFAEQNTQVFESGEILHEQEMIRLPDGEHHFDTFKVPLKKPQGEIYGLLGTSRDITELIKTKQALSERTEQLQDALTAAHAASQAKSEFLATMSHELRTPLTSVIGMSSALLKQFFGPLNPKQMEYLQVIYDSGNHLLQLINDILDLAKIESGKASLQISQFCLREVAEQSLALLRDKAQTQQIQLSAKLDALLKPDLFVGDERRVKQILLNLLSNAIKFTPAGGQVCLQMQYDGSTASIEVEDTGIGIPEAKQSLLFEAFQQIDSSLNRQHEGTGLGLALTRQLVEMHNGSIHCHSTLDVGTVFTVHLKSQSSKVEALPYLESDPTT